MTIRRSRHVKAELLVPMRVKQFPHREFEPAYSPSRMLKLGIFGGNYFAEADDDDFAGMTPGTVKLARLNAAPFAPRNNCFGVRAGLSYEEWDKRGWIFDEDPLGWFHWYCRYYAGRRHPRDAHQISRWVKYRERWCDRAQSQLKSSGKISPVIMQGLLQWSIDPYMGNE